MLVESSNSPTATLTSDVGGTIPPEAALDQLFLKSGLFDRPCRKDALTAICDLLITPYDETATVLDDTSFPLNFPYQQYHSHDKNKMQHSSIHQAEKETVSSDQSPTTLILFQVPLCATTKTRNKGAPYLPSSLKQLCLCDCLLDKDSLQNLEELEVLILWKCKISSWDFSLFPSLKALAIVDCGLPKAIDSVIEPFHPCPIPTEGTNFKSLDSYSGGLGLERLTMIRIQESQQTWKRFCNARNEWWPWWSHLRFLLLQGDEAGPDEQTATNDSNPALFLDGLPVQLLARVEELTLNSISISDSFAIRMASAMLETGKENSHLRTISFIKLGWSPRAAATVANALADSVGCQLQSLNLSHTPWLGPLAKFALHQLLQSCSKTLKQLNMNQVMETSLLSDVLIPALFQHKELVSLTLSRTQLVTNNRSLTNVSLLIAFLAQHPTLKKLDLSYSCCRDQRIWEAIISKGIAPNSSVLSTVSLEGCDIGDRGAIAIGRLLKEQSILNTSGDGDSKLTSIDLCFNDIGPTGCEAIADGLKFNSSLRRLYLHGNPCCRDEAEEISKGDVDLHCGDQDKNDASAALRRPMKSLLNVLKTTNKSLEVVFAPTSSFCKEFQYYGSVNYAGRKYIGDLVFHGSLWPRILGRVSDQPDMLYFLLQQKPDLFQRMSKSNRKTRTLAGRKRSREDS